MLDKLKELAGGIKQAVDAVVYEPAEGGFDLDDAPLDVVNPKDFGDNSTLEGQPEPVRPPDIGEKE